MTCDSETGRLSLESICRLLIVDDDPDTVKFMTVALQGQGHAIETARNGTEALTVAEYFQPHMVIMDIGLPGLDGYHVIKQLRQFMKSILIIAITGRNSPEDFKRSQEAGCDHHLVKPVDLDKLTALLARWQAQGGCESAPNAA